MAAKTKELIKETFLRLLDQMPLSKITVRAIVEECGINRNSFYYHFQDIPSLLEELIQDSCEKIISDYPTIDSLEQCIDATVAFARKNRRAVLHMFNSTSREIYERYLLKACENAVRTYYDTALSGYAVSPEDRAIIITHYKCLMFGYIVNWLENGMSGDFDASFHRMCQLGQGQVEELISRAGADYAALQGDT